MRPNHPLLKILKDNKAMTTGQFAKLYRSYKKTENTRVLCYNNNVIS